MGIAIPLSQFAISRDENFALRQPDGRRMDLWGDVKFFHRLK